MTRPALEGVSTRELIGEVRRRIADLEELHNLMNHSSPGRIMARSAPTSSKRQGALTRWHGWKEYKAKNPNATPSQFFRSKKK